MGDEIIKLALRLMDDYDVQFVEDIDELWDKYYFYAQALVEAYEIYNEQLDEQS